RLECRVHLRGEAFDELRIQPAAAALVRARRVGETIADDPGAACQRRPDDVLDVQGARGEEQEQLGDRRHRFLAVLEQELPDALRRRRAARLARGHHLEAAFLDQAPHILDVRRLADALAAFDGHETPRAHCTCPARWRASRSRARYSSTAASCSSLVTEKTWLPSPRPLATKYSSSPGAGCSAAWIDALPGIAIGVGG